MKRDTKRLFKKLTISGEAIDGAGQSQEVTG